MIYETLRCRLPRELQTYSTKYDEFNRGIHYLHADLRLLAGGDFLLAGELLKEIKKEWSPAKLFFLWLASANKRFLKPQRYYVEPTRPVQD